MHLEYIPVGQIVNAHGIRGEVKLNPKGFDPEFLAEFPVLYIDGRAMPVKHSRVHKNVLLVTLPGVEDMDAALALKGKQVSVRRADVPVPEDYYFDAELEGLTVVDCATDAAIGTVAQVLHYPAHKIYRVTGEREYLIPAVPGVFVESVDLDAGTLRVHLMKGLASDEN